MIKKATYDDINSIQQISRYYSKELGFLQKGKIQDAIDRNDLNVYLLDDTIIGFVLYRTRKDSLHTIYDIAVHPEYTHRGIGKLLIYSVPTPIKLKTTVDNTVARRFYTRQGFYNNGYHKGNKRTLVEYRKDTHAILVAGHNPVFADVARLSGWGYGTNQKDAPRDDVVMFDVEFLPDKADWQDYLDKVKQYNPLYCLVTDYTDIEQKETMLKQVQDLRDLGILYIMVCPKFKNAIDDIPKDCIISLSVPAKSDKFGGYILEKEDFLKLEDRQVHLLGGTPITSYALYKLVQDVGGHVFSYDMNCFDKASKRGTVWLRGRWYNAPDWYFDDDRWLNTMALNARNIQRMYQQQSTDVPDYKGTQTRRDNFVNNMYKGLK